MQDDHKTKEQLVKELAELRQEITKLKTAETKWDKTEKALRESEELHRITLSSISDAVFITDDQATFTFICPNVSTIFAYTTKRMA